MFELIGMCIDEIHTNAIANILKREVLGLLMFYLLSDHVTYFTEIPIHVAQVARRYISCIYM